MNAKVPDAGRQLIKFLTGPMAIPVVKAQGMEPAHLTFAMQQAAPNMKH